MKTPREGAGMLLPFKDNNDVINKNHNLLFWQKSKKTVTSFETVICGIKENGHFEILASFSSGYGGASGHLFPPARPTPLSQKRLHKDDATV